jgi:hypothetical protein
MTTDLPRLPMDDLRDLIPADWHAPAAHYPCADYGDLPTIFVPLSAIEPPPGRDEGFDLLKLRCLATDIAQRKPIPPIEVGVSARSEAHQYRVRNGFHRFYLCLELGFTSIPAVIIDD